MDVLVTRRGGFTGFTEQLGPTDVETLSAPTAGQISEIVAAIDFFELPDNLGGVPSPEGFAYGMRVADGERKHEVSWKDSSNSDRVADLQHIIALIESEGVTWGVSEQSH